jgi:hypothetical protein
MTEYLKVFFDNKCTACKQNECFNTELFATDVKEEYKTRKVGRVRYDPMYAMHEHEFTIAECPTRKIIEEKQKRVGKGLIWKLVEGSTIEKALSALDTPLVSNSDTMLVTTKNTSSEK